MAQIASPQTTPATVPPTTGKSLLSVVPKAGIMAGAARFSALIDASVHEGAKPVAPLSAKSSNAAKAPPALPAASSTILTGVATGQRLTPTAFAPSATALPDVSQVAATVSLPSAATVVAQPEIIAAAIVAVPAREKPAAKPKGNSGSAPMPSATASALNTAAMAQPAPATPIIPQGAPASGRILSRSAPTKNEGIAAAVPAGNAAQPFPLAAALADATSVIFPQTAPAVGAIEKTVLKGSVAVAPATEPVAKSTVQAMTLPLVHNDKLISFAANDATAEKAKAAAKIITKGAALAPAYPDAISGASANSAAPVGAPPPDQSPAHTSASPVAQPAVLASPAIPAAIAPSAQVAQALVGLSTAEGTHRVTVQLSPSELGRVQISIERSADGTSVINVTSERPDTLALVQADSAQLHVALDQAGISPRGRTLRFTMAGDDGASPARTIEPLSAQSGATDALATKMQSQTVPTSTDLPVSLNAGSSATSTQADMRQNNGQPTPHEPEPRRVAAGPANDTTAFLQPETAGVIRIAAGRPAIDITA